MLTWSPSCESLVAIRPFICENKRFAQKFTDRRTDRQTDDGRLAIALAHSWNELKILSVRPTVCLLQTCVTKEPCCCRETSRSSCLFRLIGYVFLWQLTWPRLRAKHFLKCLPQKNVEFRLEVIQGHTFGTN